MDSCPYFLVLAMMAVEYVEHLTKVLRDRDGEKIAPISPTLQRVVNKKRDLSHFLEDERQQQPSRTARLITPIYATVPNNNINVTTSITATGLGNSQKILKPTADKKQYSYHVFQHPFVLIHDVDYFYVPIYKEFAPSGANGRKTHPELHWNTTGNQCPFMSPQPQRPPTKPVDTSVQAAQPVLKKSRPSAVRLLRKPAALLATVENQPPQNNLFEAETAAADSAAKAAPVYKLRPGYCECCCEKYSNMENHINSDFHRQFASDSTNYACVDSFIKKLSRPFLQTLPPSPEKCNLDQDDHFKNTAFMNVDDLSEDPSSPIFKRRRSQRLSIRVQALERRLL